MSTPNESVKDMLTRDLAIQNNTDPRGIQWGIVHIKGSALYEVQITKGNKQSKVPDQLIGRFTKPLYAQEAINKYLNSAWQYSDEQAEKNARRSNKATEPSSNSE